MDLAIIKTQLADLATFAKNIGPALNIFKVIGDFAAMIVNGEGNAAETKDAWNSLSSAK